MPNLFKRMTNFIREVGADEIEHSDRTYLAHAIGVHNDMKRWGCDEELCKAGMFHSIYGTELFQRFTYPVERREDVRELIGERAEWFAYLNCAMQREPFDTAVFQTDGPYAVHDRFSGKTVEMAESDFDELVRMHICDWLEQVAHSNMWDYRRAAYRQMAKRIGGIAEDEYEQIFAMENPQSDSVNR